jgi:hypothetical protein
VIALLLLATACLGQVPTGTDPSCSWTSDVPGNADSTCRQVYATLQSIARAEQRGDTATIHRLVPVHAVAARIITYGARLRARSVRDLHVRASLTLDALEKPFVGASFDLLGKTRDGRLTAQEVVSLRLQHGQAFVVRDVPFEDDW